MPIPKLRSRTIRTKEVKVHIGQGVISKGGGRYKPILTVTLSKERALHEFVSDMTPGEAVRIGETIIGMARNIQHRCRPLPKIARGR